MTPLGNLRADIGVLEVGHEVVDGELQSNSTRWHALSLMQHRHGGAHIDVKHCTSLHAGTPQLRTD